eukprot:TRINITY_DN39007_c0_g2_i1.p1 TRINITY_DN39007_c0_g2~~TRINITY_DN39007_c0_g2_i1.p1  ORF type:complete len:694 (+),score=92.51 TRINITY_DN39007_c0_g2_i1:40-2082(+)
MRCSCGKKEPIAVAWIQCDDCWAWVHHECTRGKRRKGLRKFQNDKFICWHCKKRDCEEKGAPASPDQLEKHVSDLSVFWSEQVGVLLPEQLKLQPQDLASSNKMFPNKVASAKTFQKMLSIVHYPTRGYGVQAKQLINENVPLMTFGGKVIWTNEVVTNHQYLLDVNWLVKPSKLQALQALEKKATKKAKQPSQPNSNNNSSANSTKKRKCTLEEEYGLLPTDAPTVRRKDSLDTQVTPVKKQKPNAPATSEKAASTPQATPERPKDQTCTSPAKDLGGEVMDRETEQKSGATTQNTQAKPCTAGEPQTPPKSATSAVEATETDTPVSVKQEQDEKTLPQPQKTTTTANSGATSNTSGGLDVKLEEAKTPPRQSAESKRSEANSNIAPGEPTSPGAEDDKADDDRKSMEEEDDGETVEEKTARILQALACGLPMPLSDNDEPNSEDNKSPAKKRSTRGRKREEQEKTEKPQTPTKKQPLEDKQDKPKEAQLPPNKRARVAHTLHGFRRYIPVNPLLTGAQRKLLMEQIAKGNATLLMDDSDEEPIPSRAAVRRKKKPTAASSTSTHRGTANNGEFRLFLDCSLPEGGPAALVNHSCDPNCDVIMKTRWEKSKDEQGEEVITCFVLCNIVPRRAIAAGQEVTISYGDSFGFGPEGCKCHCCTQRERPPPWVEQLEWGLENK